MPECSLNPKSYSLFPYFFVTSIPTYFLSFYFFHHSSYCSMSKRWSNFHLISNKAVILAIVSWSLSLYTQIVIYASVCTIPPSLPKDDVFGVLSPLATVLTISLISLHCGQYLLYLSAKTITGSSLTPHVSLLVYPSGTI